MTKELARLRLGNEQSESRQIKDEPVRENDAVQPDRQLLQLRNDVGLLRGQVDSLMKEQTKLRQDISGSQQFEYSPEQKKVSAQVREAGINSLENVLTKRQEELTTSKQNYLELWKTLGVPDEVLNMEASAVLKDPRLKQYWPFFEAQRELETYQRIVDVIKLRLETEKLERNASQ